MIQLLMIALVAALWLITHDATAAHDSEQWIADGNYHDPITNRYCCGPADCAPLPPGSVAIVPGGYSVRLDGKTEFVPTERALPVSPDGRYHRCVTTITNGVFTTVETRCFIVPPRQS